jgi:hypothetical protein
MREVSASQWRRCTAEEIRIILLDPYYPSHGPLAIQRDREEGKREGTILEEVHHFLRQVPPEWFDEEDGRAQVRLARVMPTLSYFRIDDTAYVSPYVHQQVGDATLHMQVQQGGHYFGLLAKHFDALWDDKERVWQPRPDQIRKHY